MPDDEYVGGRNERNERHGVGIWKHADGREYSGGWRNGKRHGEGTMIYADGSSYSGGFEDGLRHGNGRFISATGDVYDGGWAQGRMNGDGKLVGQLVAEQPPERRGGAAVAAVRGSYEGSFVDGKLSGRGRIVYGITSAANEGPSGDATDTAETAAAADTASATVDDIASASAMGSASPVARGWQYEGELRDGRRHGQGRLGDTKGRVVYSGGWHLDRFHGYGELFHREDGRLLYRGKWRHGQRASLNFWRVRGWLAQLLRASPVARLVYWISVDAFRMALALTCLALVGLALAVLFNPVAAET